MSGREKPVSFIVLPGGSVPGVAQEFAARGRTQELGTELDIFRFGTSTLGAHPNVQAISDSEIDPGLVRRLTFLLGTECLPVLVVPLLIEVIWEKYKRRSSVVVGYEGISPERLEVASRMLAAGSEAVLLRNDRNQSIVFALDHNLRNRRLVKHWSDCIRQFSVSAHPQPEFDLWLGGALATYLCDNVAALRGLDGIGTIANVKNRQSLRQSSIVELAVCKLLPHSEALQDDPTGNQVDVLNMPCGDYPQEPESPITNLMSVVWGERRDLQAAFDLQHAQGRRQYVDWFLTRAKIEFELGDEFVLPVQRTRNGASNGNHAAAQPTLTAVPNVGSSAKGLNLIGYPRAEMGMGEQLRSCAESLNSVQIPFAINEFNYGIVASKGDRRYDCYLRSDNPYGINLFHINADQLPLAREHLGLGFFRNRYNIGYWEWELSEFPEAWLTSVDLVDEIWAPSKFIHRAISARTQKPVVWMPLAVEFRQPTIAASRREMRAAFDLPEDAYLFLFSFDFSSFSTRKNFQACLKAFRTAFPDNKKVGLVLKTIRHQHQTVEFWDLLREAGEDPRIHVIDTVLRKSKMRLLVEVCDAFVSLHRSEGFGLSIAEAMYLGKPVIATGYSGNVDFTRADNCYLVDFNLIPVKDGEYVHPVGQIWADPDIDQAAQYMARLFNNPEEGVQLGRQASAYMKREHSFKAIGKRYAARIEQIWAGKDFLAAPGLEEDNQAYARTGSVHRAGQFLRKLL